MNKLKNQVSNIEKSINATGSSSSSLTENTEKNAKATSSLSNTLKSLGAQMKDISRISLVDVGKTIIGIEAVKKAIKGVKTVMADVSAISLMEKAFAGMDKVAPIQIKGEGFTILNKETMELRSQIAAVGQEIRDTLMNGDSIDFKRLKELKGTLKGLGVSTKGLGVGFKGLMSIMKAVGVAAVTLASAVFLVGLALGAVAGIVAAFKVSKLGDEIYHTAQRFNMSSQAFQEWSYIMERAGGTIDDLTGFMETLNSEQAAVIEGSEDAISTFKRLGLSAEEVSGMRQQELFEETVKRIQQIEDATERSAIAYSLFGDEASKFMNVLNMSNQEMEETINNYHLLGGAMSGDLLEKSNSLQNSIANMKQAWQGISNTLAEVFIPVVQAVVNWLTKAFVWINLFLRTMFKLDLKSTTAGAMDGAASSTNKYAASTKKAVKAAEELKRVTMGFDELNIVSNPNKGGADSSAASSPSMGGGVDIGSMIPDASSLNLESMYAWFEKYKTLIQDITVWTLILGGIIAIAVAFGTGNVLVGIAGLAALGLGIAAGTGEGGTWDRYGTAIANFCKSAWAAITDAVSKAAKAIGDFFVGVGEWFANIGKTIAQFFVDVWNGLVSAWNAVCSFVASIPGWIYNNILVPIGNFFVGLYEGIRNGVITAWNGIISVLSTVGTWIYDKIIAPVGNFFKTMWNGFKSGASQAWEGIKSVFSGIANWFKDIFTKAWTAVKNVFSTGGKIFDGIKDGIANVFKTVVNGIIGGINKVIAVPFNAINGLLNKIRNVSVAGIEPFKSLIKYNALTVPQIPKLATGGIVTSSTIANIGEAGKEAILPLENNTEWMDTLAGKIAERNSAPSKIVLQVGEKELGWATINGINNITKQTGNIQLVL